ncbi:MAG: glycosyltransferase, partial [Gammaproteobacteria bacterium]
MAPIPLLDYSNPQGEWARSRGIPRRRTDGRLEIWHPRWLYPPFGTPLNAFSMYARLNWPLRQLRQVFPFQLIEAHFGHPEGVAAAKLARALNVPFTITFRGNETRDASNPALRRAIAEAVRKAARVITVSNNLHELAIALGAPSSRVKTVPNGINTAIFHAQDRIYAREKHHIPLSVRVILSAGYLIERKGHHKVIRALKTLSDHGVEAQLLIAGSAGREGRFEETLHALVNETGMRERVRFLGQLPVESLAEVMCAADVLCLASSRDGWPNVVNEASGCGTPVVATNVGGVADMLPGEEYGFVVPVDDQAALETALERALTKQWDRDAIAR